MPLLQRRLRKASGWNAFKQAVCRHEFPTPAPAPRPQPRPRPPARPLARPPAHPPARRAPPGPAAAAWVQTLLHRMGHPPCRAMPHRAPVDRGVDSCAGAADPRRKRTPEAEVYPLVFQGISAPFGIKATAGNQPVSSRQTARQCRSTGVVADLARRHGEPQSAALCIRDGMQPGAHPARRATDQTPAPIVGPRSSGPVRREIRPNSPSGSMPCDAVRLQG